VTDANTGGIYRGSDRGGYHPPKQSGTGRAGAYNTATENWLRTPGGPGSDGNSSNHQQAAVERWIGQHPANPYRDPTLGIDLETRALWARLTVDELAESKWAIDKKIKTAAIFCFAGLMLVIISVHMLHRIYGSMMTIIAETYPDDGPMPADVRGHKR